MKNLLLSLVLLLCITSLKAQTFLIDPGHTAVTSKVQRFGMVDVLGRFNEVEGKIELNGSDMTSLSVDVSIKTGSYSSNNPGGENAVKSPAFLDAAKYPEINFKSKRVNENNGNLSITGELTIHGVTKEVSFPFKIINPSKDPTGLNTVAASATLEINRQDYGIKFDRKLPNGTPLIGNLVIIELNVLAAEQE